MFSFEKRLSKYRVGLIFYFATIKVDDDISCNTKPFLICKTNLMNWWYLSRLCIMYTKQNSVEATSYTVLRWDGQNDNVGEGSSILNLCDGGHWQKIYISQSESSWKRNVHLMLFAAWYFLTVHNKSHNMKELAILSNSWSPFLTLTCKYGKYELLWVSVWSSGVFSREKIPPDHPCKSLDHDHHWADLVMAWLP